ncbi:hypothetical protein, partial [Streptococcus ovuberis]|uniref:hypothetical protein n=1 Tax=Streptococcus ovuberis TaxID=1936207 RepID=UPI001B34734D
MFAFCSIMVLHLRVPFNVFVVNYIISLWDVFSYSQLANFILELSPVICTAISPKKRSKVLDFGLLF